LNASAIRPAWPGHSSGRRTSLLPRLSATRAARIVLVSPFSASPGCSFLVRRVAGSVLALWILGRRGAFRDAGGLLNTSMAFSRGARSVDRRRLELAVRRLPAVADVAATGERQSEGCYVSKGSGRVDEAQQFPTPAHVVRDTTVVSDHPLFARPEAFAKKVTRARLFPR
jgi:hypothetical protein